MHDGPVKEKIGVGVIGASADRGWAATAHIPALKALPQYEIRALSTSRAHSARRAAEKFGITLAFDNHEELVNHPDVDLVVVTVKVPQHRELVTAALNAGKHVYCEWPLGNGLKEAEELAVLAKEKRVHAVVGLQARFSPAIQQVRRLVADGYVGRVLSTSLVGSGMAWGGVSAAADAYVSDHRNGATLLTIPLGHTIDAVCCALGEFQSLTAVMATNLVETTLIDTQTRIAKTAEDQIVIGGVLESGATICVHYRGGRSRGTNFLWEINGTQGDLLLTGPGGHVQFMEPALRGGRGSDKALAELPIADEFRWVPASVPPGAPFNVAQSYVRLAEDLRNGTHHVATFEHAVARHRMLEAVQIAAHTGQRQLLRGY
jgi:predicted dehydrogenase